MKYTYSIIVPAFTLPERKKPAGDRPAHPRVRTAEPRKQREFVDFDSVPGHQWEIHQRLLNWARATRDIPVQKVAAGFDLYRASDSRREYGAVTVTVVNQGDAQKIAFGVLHLPEEDLRPAIQWFYIKGGKNPGGLARELGKTVGELAGMVTAGRQMLMDRGV